MATYNGVIVLDVSWTSLKAFATSKNLAVQYEQSVSAYEIFCVDGRIAYKTIIFRNSVPNTIEYNQSTNDADKSDFETNFKDVVTNRVTTPSATYDGYAITTANPTLIAGSDGSFIRTLRSDASGRLITVGLGTAGTPAGGVVSIQGVSGGQPISVTGTISATNASTGSTGASSPAQATYIAGLSTTAAPTYTNNQLNALSLTTAGALRVDGSATTQPVSGTITANAGTGNFNVVGTGTSGVPAGGVLTVQGATGMSTLSTGGTVNTTAPTWLDTQLRPLSLTLAGRLRVDGSEVTQPVSGTITANAGTGNFTVVQSTAANLRSQTASEATIATATGTVASLTGGAVTTAAPTYTTGQMNPLSLTTGGLLRVDGSGVTQPISGTVTVGNLLVVTGQSTDNTSNSTAKLPVIAAVATTAAPTYSSGNMVPLSTDTSGNLRITGTIAGTGNFTVVQGTASNLRAQTSSESNTGAAPPAQAGLVGGSVTTAAPSYTNGQMSALSLTTAGALRVDSSTTTQPVSGTITANAGTGNFTVVQSTAANLRSQTASEATTGTSTPTVAGLVGGAVTTAAPTYTNGQMSPLSLDTSGALRITGSISASNPSVSTVNASPPASATYMGALVTNSVPTLTNGQMSAVTLNTRGDVRTMSASEGNTNASAGVFGTMVGGTVNDSEPSYASGNFESISLTTQGQVRVFDNSLQDNPNFGALNALNASVSVSLSAHEGVGFHLQTGTLNATLVPEISFDFGTTWVATIFYDGASTLTVTGGAAAAASLPLVGGVTNIRIRVSAYTSGSSNIWLIATQAKREVQALVDNAPFWDNSTRVIPTGQVFDEVAGTALTENDIAVSRIDSKRAQVMTIEDSSTRGQRTAVSSNGALKIEGGGIPGDPSGGVLAVLSPNNEFNGAFTGLNSTWTVTMTGSRGVGFYLAAGTLIGTVVAELSFDGTNWFQTTMTDPVANVTSANIIFTSNNTATYRSIELVAGVYQARVRISAFTSGTCNIWIRAGQLVNSNMTVSSTDGTRTTYTAAITGLVPPATPTDCFTITGSATKTVRICRIAITGTQTTAAQRDIQIVRRSTANTGGTSTTLTGVPHDSQNPAATATVRAYTANPSSLGTLVGVIRSRKVFIAGTSANSDEFAIEFGTRNDQGIVLRGTSQVLAINLNSVTSGGNNYNISITWIEE